MSDLTETGGSKGKKKCVGVKWEKAPGWMRHNETVRFILQSFTASDPYSAACLYRSTSCSESCTLEANRSLYGAQLLVLKFPVLLEPLDVKPARDLQPIVG